MIKFIHTSDIHLDSPLRGLEYYEGAPVDSIRGATRQAFKNLVELAISEKVDFILIAGDLYDGDWKDYNTGLFFASQMSKLREAGIRVFIVSGNHDAASRISRRLRMPENVKVFSAKKPETITIDDLDIAIHGQSFARQAITEDMSTAYPDAITGHLNIGILHTSAAGCEGHEPYAPCSVEGLLSKGYDYWALGHVHKREILHEDPWIIFSGCIQGRHIREIGEKGCTLVSADDGRITEVEHKEIDVLRWSIGSVDVSEAENVGDVVDLVSAVLEEEAGKSDGRPLALRLMIKGNSKAHAGLIANPEQCINDIREVATDISTGDIWIEKVKIKTAAQIDIEEMRNRDDAIGELLRAIDNLSIDRESLSGMMDEFSDLKRKLPVELRQGEDSINLDDPEQLEEIIADVKQILFARLFT
ncbi:MAG TPA: DNA repair exonuclease [Nitrospirae bacterium]|nr:putative metallophosphoesterase YhaO [bacterium BMS3Abin06]HDH12213.1 DNA repair exonuclease [Nitrospirota bacterium]HDZ00203.1 DNA repair exonuclease [Nitrospirota bacterium]